MDERGIRFSVKTPCDSCGFILFTQTWNGNLWEVNQINTVTIPKYISMKNIKIFLSQMSLKPHHPKNCKYLFLAALSVFSDSKAFLISFPELVVGRAWIARTGLQMLYAGAFTFSVILIARKRQWEMFRTTVLTCQVVPASLLIALAGLFFLCSQVCP